MQRNVLESPQKLFSLKIPITEPKINRRRLIHSWTTRHQTPIVPFIFLPQYFAQNNDVFTCRRLLRFFMCSPHPTCVSHSHTYESERREKKTAHNPIWICAGEGELHVLLRLLRIAGHWHSFGLLPPPYRASAPLSRRFSIENFPRNRKQRKILVN